MKFSFGLADRGLAAAEAALEGGLSDFGKNYTENMEVKRTEDARDARDYALERTVGQGVGLVAGLAATGPTGALVKAGLRGIPGAAKLMTHAAKLPKNKLLRAAGVDPRGLTTAAAGSGALMGVAGEGISDVASGRRSSIEDYAGAALGGALGGAAALRKAPIVSKAVLGGAVGGGATSLAQDALNGRAPSFENAIQATHVGGTSAGALDGLGTHAAAALPRKMKGELGETMSALKTAARGRIPDRRQRVPLPNGREARPDQTQNHRFFGLGRLDAPEYLEVKLGPSTSLSRRQLELRAQDPDRFAIDAWQFRHVGRGASLLGGALGGQIADGEQFPWRAR